VSLPYILNGVIRRGGRRENRFVSSWSYWGPLPLQSRIRYVC